MWYIVIVKGYTLNITSFWKSNSFDLTVFEICSYKIYISLMVYMKRSFESYKHITNINC